MEKTFKTMGWDPEQKPSVAVYIPKAERESPEELRRNPAKTCDADQNPKRQRISRIAEAKKRIKLLNRTREQRREDRRLMKQRLKFQKKKAKSKKIYIAKGARRLKGWKELTHWITNIAGLVLPSKPLDSFPRRRKRRNEKTWAHKYRKLTLTEGRQRSRAKTKQLCVFYGETFFMLAIRWCKGMDNNRKVGCWQGCFLYEQVAGHL